MTTTVPLSLPELTRTIESRDADGIIAFYATDAVLTVFDRDHPPAAPLVFRGVDAIATYYHDVCGRNIHHAVVDAILTVDGLAYAQHCRYPDGTQVVCTTVAALQDGRIQRQTAVQTWDS